jgi:peptidoglycan/LPS O-acetylase OafA/YrhL
MLRHPALALSAATAAVVVVASASYWIVEQPFLRLKKRFEIARPQPASDEVPVASNPVFPKRVPIRISTSN